MRVKVEIFAGDDIQKLQERINFWMSEKSIQDSDIINILQSESGDQSTRKLDKLILSNWILTISIWYKMQ